MDLDGRGICCVWSTCPGPNMPSAAVQIYTSKKAGVVLNRPIGDKEVAEEVNQIVSVVTSPSWPVASASLHHAVQPWAGLGHQSATHS